jgi:hypothetical protein
MKHTKAFFAALTCLLWISIDTSRSVGQENSPMINSGVKEFYQLYRSMGLNGVIARIRECWSELEATKTQDAIAFCFSLDYSISTFEEIAAKNRTAPQPEFTKIEKTLGRVNRALKKFKADQDRRGILIAGWVEMANVMLQEYAKRSGDVRPTASEAENQAAFTKAKAAVSRKIGNVQPQQFEALERVTTPNMKGVPTDVVCGKVKIKIKNSSGGQVSLRRFVYFVGDGTAYYDNGRADADLDVHVINNFCVN